MHACTQNFFSRRIRGIILSSTGEGSEAYFRKFYYGYFISFNIPGVSRPPPPVHSCMAPFIHLSLYIAFQYIHVSSVCTIHDHSYICVRVWVGMILLKKKNPGISAHLFVTQKNMLPFKRHPYRFMYCVYILPVKLLNTC